ncbi:virulence plasmid B protein [Candidatus Methanophagaceae archaeon]|nr:virulence plasmid B protein [Methanophagales archaeon]
MTEETKANKPEKSVSKISLPKSKGAIKGIGEKFPANPVTGTGSFSVPIFTTPNRSDFYSQLALYYDSCAGNGPFRLGWSLSVPAISRKAEKCK